jgi:nucleoside phosphorylase
MQRVTGDQQTVGTTSTVLLLVATSIERAAVLAAVRASTGHDPQPWFLPSQTVLRLGRISNTEVLLHQTGQGAIGPSGAAIASSALIRTVMPDYVILTGMCFGLRPDQQVLGDVVVSRQMRAIDHRKIYQSAADQPPLTVIRGDFVSASPTLLDRFTALTYNFHTATVHHGTILSAGTLGDSPQFVEELLRIDPEAQAAEMEGAGVYAAAAPDRAEWIIVKGISDWGFNKDDNAQKRASDNASAFILHVIRAGALDKTSASGSSQEHWRTTSASALGA